MTDNERISSKMIKERKNYDNGDTLANHFNFKDNALKLKSFVITITI